MKEKKVEQKQKGRNKGITLVALVVTIVVLLILAGVTITMLVGDNGIIARAREAKNAVEKAQGNEQNELGDLANQLANVLGENTTVEPPDPPTPIDTTKSYVGYYADIEGNGTVDGVIFADLAVGKSGQWNDSNGAYSYTAITGTKDYYISQKEYVGNFNTEAKPVISPIKESTGVERFYIMALEDLDSLLHYWYYNAYGNMGGYEDTTSVNFGAGKTNTDTMIVKYEKRFFGNEAYGPLTDLWGLDTLKSEVSGGWFVPSKEEWSAFADAFSLTRENYISFGLRDVYFSSSIRDYETAWSPQLIYSGRMYGTDVNASGAVRLATTF